MSLTNKPTENKFIRAVNTIEDSLLIMILTAMIIFAVYQIIARNLFGEGVVWIDPLLRTLVLWVGMAGAVVATRTDNHIRIDVFAKYLPEIIQPYIQRFVYLFTLSVCLLIAWNAARFVYSEYEYNTIAFSGVPSWLTALIIPLSFTLIAIRYVLLFIRPYERKVALVSEASITDKSDSDRLS
ncbi:MAG: TRAP transporter small permease [Proteobacteria bacterium]|nr:TRAP transporter small permease [Pseudomonadota bacterium]